MITNGKVVYSVSIKTTSSGNKVLINSLIYSCSGLLLKCFSFFLLPLYTTYLTTEDYGITSVVSSFIATACYVVAFSLYSAIMRFYVEFKDDPIKLKRFYGTIVTFAFLSGVVFLIVFSIFRRPLSKLLFLGLDYFPLVFVCLIMLIFNCQHTIFDNILRSQQKAMKCSICSIIYFFLGVTFNIFFVVVLKLGALGTMLATLCAYVLYTTYFVIEMSLTRSIEFCLDIKLLKSALKYSVPIIPHNISTQIAVLVSKLFISGSGSLSVLGVYTVATQFGNLADTIQGYVDSAYGPWLYEKLHNKEEGFKKVIRENVNLLTSAIGLFFIGISLFAHDYIVLFVEKSYVGSWKYVPLIVAVYGLKTAYYFFVEILLYYKEASRKVFWATMTGSIMNVFLSCFFIPWWGVYGSILADAVSMLIRTAIVILISKKQEDVGLKVRDFVKNYFVIEAFVAFGLILSATKYQSTFSIIDFGYRCCVVILYIVVSVMLNIQTVKAFWIRYKNKRSIIKK